MPTTIDKPISTLSYKTVEQAYEAAAIIEYRQFPSQNKAEEYAIACIGHPLHEMTDSQTKQYAKHLIEEVQGTDEGQFAE